MKRILVIGILILFLFSGCGKIIDPVSILSADYAVKISQSIYIGTAVKVDASSSNTSSIEELSNPSQEMMGVTTFVEEVLQGEVEDHATVTTMLPARYADWVTEGERYVLFSYPSTQSQSDIDTNPYWAVKINDNGDLDNPDLDRLLAEKYESHGSRPRTIEEMRALISKVSFIQLVQRVQALDTMKDGIITQTFDDDAFRLLQDFWGIPKDGAIQLTRLQYNNYFETSFFLLYTEMDSMEADVFARLLLNHYEILEDIPIELTGFSFGMDEAQCVNQYTHRDDPHRLAFLFDNGDHLICVFYADRFSQNMIQYAYRQIKDGNDYQ